MKTPEITEDDYEGWYYVPEVQRVCNTSNVSLKYFDGVKYKISELPSQFKASPSSEKTDFRQHDCEFFLITDVAVYACECDPHHIEIDGKEYIPIEEFKVGINELENGNHNLESSLKSEKELNLNLIQTIGEKDKEIERLKDDLKRAEEYKPEIEEQAKTDRVMVIAAELETEYQTKIEEFLEVLRYAESYLKKGGFGKVDCLIKVSTVLQKHTK